MECGESVAKWGKVGAKRGGQVYKHDEKRGGGGGFQKRMFRAEGEIKTKKKTRP